MIPSVWDILITITVYFTGKTGERLIWRVAIILTRFVSHACCRTYDIPYSGHDTLHECEKDDCGDAKRNGRVCVIWCKKEEKQHNVKSLRIVSGWPSCLNGWNKPVFWRFAKCVVYQCVAPWCVIMMVLLRCGKASSVAWKRLFGCAVKPQWGHRKGSRGGRIWCACLRREYQSLLKRIVFPI